MNKNTISIAHLYNPSPIGLDDVYGDNVSALNAIEHSVKFGEEQEKLIVFFNKSSIDAAVYVLIRAYKDRYPTSQILNIYSSHTKSHGGIDKRTDLEIDWHTERDKIDFIEITFKNDINLELLSITIEEALNDKQFQLNGNVYKVINSPINTITFSETSLIIEIHNSKVINY